MAKPEHTEQHGQHLAGDSDRNQKQRREARQSVENKQLSNSTARRKAENMFQGFRVARKERNGRVELRLGRRGNRDRQQIVQDATLRQMRHGQQIRGSQDGREDVLGNHHLRAGEAGVPVWRGKDMVLRGVGQAVQEEVDGQQEDAPQGRAGLLLRGRCSNLLARPRVVQCERGDAQRDEEHDAVLVQRVSLAEDGQVQEHDRE